MKAKALLLSVVFSLSLVRIGYCQETEEVRIGYCQETEEAKQPVDPNAKPKIKYRWYGIDLLAIRRGLEGKLGVELSAIVQSKHMWHGFDLLDDHGVFLPIATVSLADTGFSGKIIGGYSLSGGHEKSDELNYAAFYTGAFLQDTRYVTNFTANYFYYGKPKVHYRKNDSQEIGISWSWPKLLGSSGLLPNYYFGRIWPTRSHSNLEGCEGFIHVLGLAYDLTIPNFGPEGRDQTFRLSGDITYNDGFGGGGVKHDWSHAVLGVSTNLGTGNVTVTPYLNFQISMDDSVNKEEELWCGVNLTYRF